MLINFILFYILSYIISYKYLLTYIIFANALNSYNNNLSKVLFYICMPYNIALLGITFLKLRLNKYKLCKKIFKIERKSIKYYYFIKKRVKYYFRRKKMNSRINSISKKLSNKVTKLSTK